MAADNHESESEPDEIIVYPPYLEYIGAFFEAWKFVEAGAKSEAENPDTDADADAAAFPNNNYPINPEPTPKTPELEPDNRAAQAASPTQRTLSPASSPDRDKTIHQQWQ